ncbi:MAG: MFS transporter, partial [Clostridia bacterium]|nr:MFS transporter [Clostridia bacterium]
MIPAALGLIVMLFVKERREPKETMRREAFWKNWRVIPGNLKLYLLVAFIFTLGNSSNTFLLLRAKNIGFTDINVVLLYFAYNMTASLAAIPFGKLSDKIGRKKLLVCGYLVFAAVYLGFAAVKSAGALVAIFILYGVYTAMTSGVERAMIAEISPPGLKGTMLGLHATIVGVALLPSSIIAGILWESIGAFAPFVFGAGLSLCAAVILTFMLKSQKA